MSKFRLKFSGLYSFYWPVQGTGSDIEFTALLPVCLMPNFRLQIADDIFSQMGRLAVFPTPYIIIVIIKAYAYF